MAIRNPIRRLPLTVCASILAGAAPADFQTSGFENPQIPTNTYVATPSNFAGWGFAQSGSWRSGVANGNGSWGTGAHSGTQYAFLQGQSSMTQTVSGLTPGQSYSCQFWTARRNGGLGADVTDNVDMTADGVNILQAFYSIDQLWRQYESKSFTATSSSVTVQLHGITNADQTSLFDDFAVVPDPVITDPANLLNPSFETPNLQPSGWNYNPIGPIGVGWTFTPQVGAIGSGIASQGSPWGLTLSGSVGKQYAYLQRSGAISQMMKGLTVGQQYSIAFQESVRPGLAQMARVLVNGVQILGPVAGASGSWTPHQTPYFTATSSEMMLQIEGVDTGADRAALIDDVRLVPEPPVALALLLGLVPLVRRGRASLREPKT